MGPFEDNDPFDRLVREFFGGRARSRDDVIQGEEDERSIDFIETKNYLILVFEMPGYTEKDVDVNVNGSNLKVSASRKSKETDDDYIASKLLHGIEFSKKLPSYVNPKKYNKTFKNGVLEIKFERTSFINF